MHGAIPSFSNMPSWCGAQLKKSTGTTLPIPYHITTRSIWFISMSGSIFLFVSCPCCIAEPMLDVGGCSDGSVSSLGRSPFTKQRRFKCMGKASSKSSSSGVEGAKWDEVRCVCVNSFVLSNQKKCLLTNSLVAEMEGSAVLIPKLATGHNPEPFPFTCHTSISLKSVLMLILPFFSPPSSHFPRSFTAKILYAFLVPPI
jgi:hypothetical protein